MFRRTKVVKTRIALMDMRLVDIPPMNTLLFLKAKQGRTGVQTPKYPIERTSVTFKEPVLLDYELPENPLAHHPKPLRISFRRETTSKSGFTRYGNCEIDIMQMVLTNTTEIRLLLSDCPYNTYFLATLCLLEGCPYEPGVIQTEIASTTEEQHSDDSGSSTLSTLSSRRSSSETGAHTELSLINTAPVKISPDRFRELEQQVDDLLASIITNSMT
jgi:hypothetical protein